MPETKLYTFRADPALIDEFDEACRRQGWNRTEGIKHMMRKLIDLSASAQARGT